MEGSAQLVPSSFVRSPQQEPFSATAIIVIYEMDPLESNGLWSLLDSRKMMPPSRGEVHIVVWDHSAARHWDSKLPDGVLYRHDARNLGLANAYNRVLELADSRGSTWLITLDQDTSVPPGYLSEMSRYAERAAGYPGVCAVVPQVEEQGRRLSPNRFLWGGVPVWYPRGFSGVPAEPVFAFNSGSMIRVDSLLQIGGYDPQFPLDYTDAQLFRKLQMYGKRVQIAGDIQIQHSLSMKDLKERMRPDRYRRALLAETAFWDQCMNRLAGWERTVRLTLRMVRHWVRRDPVALRVATWDAIKMRLLFSKQRRLEIWRSSLQDQLGEALGSSGVRSRPSKVSVCMAAYNGARYIAAQLTSILPQLDSADEIVIVDDGSTDGTVEVVQSFRDARIRLFRHAQNMGIVNTFEEALRRATGDLLFLSDDDDIWASDKVEKFCEAFARSPEARVVISRVRVINEMGVEVSDSRMGRGGKFAPGFWHNVIANHYQGSAMAIRASFLGSILPFPRGKSFVHDVWIGTRNDLLGGRTVYLNEELLFYRRHSRNSTRIKSLSEKLQTRVELLVAHALYALRVVAS
jgi:GT2 family glycosyltransferase